MLEVTVPVYKKNIRTLSIGIPCWRADIKPKFLVSLLKSVLDKDLPIIDTYLSQNISIDDSRIEIAKETKGDFVLMSDPDMTFTPEDIKKLMKHDKDIIAGLFFQRSKPHKPLMFQKIEKAKRYVNILKYPKGLIEVDAVGTGFILIKRTVFEKLPMPWFLHTSPEKGLSEDLYFCSKAKENGFKIYVDTTVKIGHIGEHEATEEDFIKTYCEDNQ
jgi:hypothetical protein